MTPPPVSGPVRVGPVPVGPVRVGLVGAGTWAQRVHAPMLAAGPETVLTGVWARRPEAAAPIAAAHATTVAATFEELIARSEAIAFAVPPDVQAVMAVLAAEAGRHLLLEKPIALDLPAAERLAAAAADVISMVVLTWRYAAATRAFLADAQALDAVGGRAWFVSGAFLGGWFSTPWRLEHGALWDLGPHVVDVLDAALGPVVSIHAHGDSRQWLGLLLDHTGGAVSEASLSGAIDPAGRTSGIEVYSRDRHARLDTGALGEDAFATIRAEFAHAVRTGERHPLDVGRGLYLQRLLSGVEFRRQ